MCTHLVLTVFLNLSIFYISAVLCLYMIRGNAWWNALLLNKTTDWQNMSSFMDSYQNILLVVKLSICCNICLLVLLRNWYSVHVFIWAPEKPPNHSSLLSVGWLIKMRSSQSGVPSRKDPTEPREAKMNRLHLINPEVMEQLFAAKWSSALHPSPDALPLLTYLSAEHPMSIALNNRTVGLSWRC